MYLSRFKILDYKCFLDSGEARLDPSFNVVVGKNNAGKSALLEMLNIRASPANTPHASPSAPVAAERVSKIRFSVTLCADEIRDAVRRFGRTYIPCPSTISAGEIDEYLTSVFELDEYEFSYEQGGGAVSYQPYPIIRLSDCGEYTNRSIVVVPNEAGQIVAKQIEKTNDGVLSNQILETIQGRLFVFRAERLSVARTSPAEEDVLRPNASNLPSVLHRLQEDRYAMEAYVEALRTVIPSVAHVSVGYRDGNFVIQVLPDYSTKEANYAQPLENCGTGLGQVMALLYVVLKMDSGIVVIDEPNSFLHPGATKQLINIMRQNRRNQYVISTHSPEVIVASSPCRVVQVSRAGTSSVVRSFDSGAVSELRNVLDELGVSLSDVFGIDGVVWVEGETERDAFPLILETFFGGVPAGVAYVPMRASELAAKRRIAEVSANLHLRLATTSAIIPAIVGFAFDGELRDGAERERINKIAKGRAHFLPRRMLENYLFHEEAIAFALLAESPDAEIGTDDVRNWLIQNAGFDASTGRLDHPDLVNLDGAKVLKDVYWELGKVSFSKTRDSVRIVSRILKVEPQFLGEVASYVQKLTDEPEAIR
jgi:predicted ATPase